MFLFRFNSSMVRLGGMYGIDRSNIPEMFQFQYGSIGSTLKKFTDCLYNVSIPVWFDWEFQISVRPGDLVRFNSSMVRLGGA